MVRLPSGFQIKAARSLIGLHQSQLAKDAGVDTGTVSRMEAAGKQSARGLARNVENVVLALEKRGVAITENGVELVAKPKRR
jgi:predicted transcriptional regulator